MQMKFFNLVNGISLEENLYHPGERLTDFGNPWQIDLINGLPGAH